MTSQTTDRWVKMAGSETATVDSLAAVLLQLGDTEQFDAQEQLISAVNEVRGWDVAEQVDNRYVELLRKFG